MYVATLRQVKRLRKSRGGQIVPCTHCYAGAYVSRPWPVLGCTLAALRAARRWPAPHPSAYTQPQRQLMFTSYHVGGLWRGTLRQLLHHSISYTKIGVESIPRFILYRRDPKSCRIQIYKKNLKSYVGYTEKSDFIKLTKIIFKRRQPARLVKVNTFASKRHCKQNGLKYNAAVLTHVVT